MVELSLIEAVKAGDSDKAIDLINKGADVNQQDGQGWTPLNFAAGKGNLTMVQLLVDKGADVFKVGRDQRTPYDIALAAGRVAVAKYLRAVEDAYQGEKPIRPERKYCRAYHLRDLRKYPAWSESRINWKESGDRPRAGEKGETESEDLFTDEKIVFVHQDYTVTESMWQNENVIFGEVNSDWKGFCAGVLNFKVPDDLDLIVANEATS